MKHYYIDLKKFIEFVNKKIDNKEEEKNKNLNFFIVGTCAGLTTQEIIKAEFTAEQEKAQNFLLSKHFGKIKINNKFILTMKTGKTKKLKINKIFCTIPALEILKRIKELKQDGEKLTLNTSNFLKGLNTYSKHFLKKTFGGDKYFNTIAEAIYLYNVITPKLLIHNNYIVEKAIIKQLNKEITTKEIEEKKIIENIVKYGVYKPLTEIKIIEASTKEATTEEEEAATTTSKEKRRRNNKKEIKKSITEELKNHMQKINLLLEEI